MWIHALTCLMLFHTTLAAMNPTQRAGAQPQNSKSIIPLVREACDRDKHTAKPARLRILENALKQPHISEPVPVDLCKLIFDYALSPSKYSAYQLVLPLSHGKYIVNKPVIQKATGLESEFIFSALRAKHAVELSNGTTFLIGLGPGSVDVWFSGPGIPEPREDNAMRVFKMSRHPYNTQAFIPLSRNRIVHVVDTVPPCLTVADLSNADYKTMHQLGIAALDAEECLRVITLPHDHFAALIRLRPQAHLSDTSKNLYKLVRWDINTKQPRQILDMPNRIHHWALAYLKHQHLFAIGVGREQEQRQISLIHANTGQEERHINTDLTSDISALMPYAHNQLIVHSHNDAIMRFFNIHTGACTMRIDINQQLQPLRGDPINQLDDPLVAPDGSLTVSWGKDWMPVKAFDPYNPSYGFMVFDSDSLLYDQTDQDHSEDEKWATEHDNEDENSDQSSPKDIADRKRSCAFTCLRPMPST